MADIETNAPARPLPFVHSPLPDSETHIRLLEVLQGNFEHHVVCVMSAWPLDSAPPYSAISYTWGDPALTATITIDGRNMVVGQNCEYALQQTFAIEKKKKEKYVWVDAVCIDQNNIQERGHQVAIMGKVYSKAAQVFACVGPHAEDIEFLQIICRKKKNLLADILSAVHWYPWDAWFSLPQAGVWLGTRCLLSMSTSTKIRLRKASVAFLKRPYFRRVWILQELSMGTNVVVCCGSSLILASHVLALDVLLRCENRIDIGNRKGKIYDTIKVKYMKAVLSISRSCDSISCREENNATLEPWWEINPRRGCLVLATRGLEGRLHDLYNVMDHINEFECADARDKLYGILNLVHWSSGFTPTPDYQKSTFNVAVDALGSLKSMPSGRGALSWAQHIATIFEISPMDVAIKDRLRMRRNNALSSKPSVPNSRRPQFLEYYWSGDPIIDRGDQAPSRSLEGLCCSTSKTQNGKVELVDGDHMLCVLAPPQTTAGDWVITMGPTFTKYWDSTGLIVRSSGSSQYTIVGLARMTEHYSKIEQGEFFRLRWDPEDLLLLYLAAMEPDKLDIEELHSIQICGAKDSSFAVKEKWR
ncbi:hypothetical protein HBI56_089210 [Parastagonospora nodorum]|uniref:Heterokaryon incompatibility domain-containing protein n=1 Tax=Phaeosphaeria nodorum (strain SN15 / ATCC MYA-4574 / FGSC 10173) TaxID=321614 RepID=A0A7U2FHT4_PHANO|nr:hypothetical protein HBH56_110250 [Parastagonospora nodorum]QRD03325.1 hypothetical protein JI435_101070 [Parastagonospora nodorum SN15]KAH3925601.1 hypothetical protein HBH54_180090 [Parastagonospora nodorum]KAH3974293.1 hypothetical protein HBH51_092290 [Parastagonospora nodorum]KAH3979344.1 hypothetical protein HBH52_100280 [Parastagonospora nodorum]